MITDLEPSDLAFEFDVPAEINALKVRNNNLTDGIIALCIGFGITGLILFIRHRITQNSLYELHNQDKQH